MEALELEFFKQKESGQFAAMKNLMNEKFAMGTKAIINLISNQIKRGLFTEEEMDATAIIQRVLDECKIVR